MTILLHASILDIIVPAGILKNAANSLEMKTGVLANLLLFGAFLYTMMVPERSSIINIEEY